jgi:SnoaL-like domain
MPLSRRQTIMLAAASLALTQAEAAIDTKKMASNRRPRGLKEQVQRLADIHDIQTMMSRYEFFHVAMLNQQCVDLFVANTPGAKLEIAHLGVYDGIEGIRRFFLVANKPMGGESGRIGQMHLHTLTTPVIEVAGDGRTAQAVWLSPGVETGGRRDNGDTNASWAWVKYGIDFAKEGELWKIWHFGMFRIFESSYNESWAATPPGSAEGSNPDLTAYEVLRARLLASLPAEARPDRPNSYSWIYSPKVAWENIPKPPEPYDTWDDSRAYVK